jgi:hypothetical protein
MVGAARQSFFQAHLSRLCHVRIFELQVAATMSENMPKLSVGLTGLLVLSLLQIGLATGCDSSGPDADESQASQSQTKAAAVGATAASAAADRAGSASNSAHDDRYDLRSPDSPVIVGQKQKVELAITPGDGLKINKEFPWKFEFSAPEGVQLAQKQVAGAQIDLAESKATIPMHLEASQAGKHSLDATADFSVCNDTKCWVIRDQKVSFNLKADPADAEAAAEEDGKSGEAPE